MTEKKTEQAVEQKSPQHEALEQIQQLIYNLPEDRQADVLMYAEDIRDILKEGGHNAFMALTLIALEFGAVHAELEKDGAEDEQASEG